jgi:hypothetical protein
MTQNVREHLPYIEPPAHEDWCDRSKQSLLHNSLCTHGSPSFIEIVDVYMYHQSLFSLESSRAGTETLSP